MEAIDPVCLVHGLKRSEHVCLYCCLCFNSLTKEECSYLPDGQQVDICIPCAEAEREQLVHYAQLWNKQRSDLRNLEDKLGIKWEDVQDTIAALGL